MDTTLAATTAVAGLLIGFGKAGVAGTLGPIVTVLMALTLPADDAIGLLLPMLIVADAFSVDVHWRKWEIAVVVRLVMAALAGIAAGTFLIATVSADTLRTLIAVATLLFVAGYAWLRRATVASEPLPALGLVAGGVAGLTSTVAHLGGPPVVAYLMTTRLDPGRLVATSVAFFAAINLLKVPGYFLAGLFDVELIASTIWAWLSIPAGVILGRAMIDRIDRSTFDRVTLLLLTAGSVILLAT